MDKLHYDEMLEEIDRIDKELGLAGRKIFVFGHCDASLELIDFLSSKGVGVSAILDNSEAKQGIVYNGISVIKPGTVMGCLGENNAARSVVLIASRFYSEMARQLKAIGYDGPVEKVIDYNTFAEYSLSEETIANKKNRERQGYKELEELSDKYKEYFKVLCPFGALGDIYYMISYWEAYAKKRNIGDTVFCVPGAALADVIHLFGDYPVEVYGQKVLDAMVQSAIYTKDKECFIPHQDRPYVVNLHRALYVKKIPFEQMYCCGVYGLKPGTEPAGPVSNLPQYKDLEDIPEGKAVILSPYAKSVIALVPHIWEEIVDCYTKAGYRCYTNVIDNETPLAGTCAISPSIPELQSVVERAGTFIGIRNGICDILKYSKARKIALYPDYNYCDTRWKAIDIYSLEEFENVVVKGGDSWKEIQERIRV